MLTANAQRRDSTPLHRGAAVFLVTLSIAPLVNAGAEPNDEVLIYYANETAPEGPEAANCDTIIGWLRSGNHDTHAVVVDQLERDRGIFAAAVDVETSTFLCNLPDIGNGPQAVILTNRLVRKGKCLLWRRGWGSFREFDFSVESYDNYILAANPLSDPKTMRRALDLVAEQFDPDGHQFILVTKSHGSRSKAITPRLAVRAEETTREELLRLAAAEVPEGELPEWIGKLGISKEQYFTILGESEMHFSLVYWEACQALSEEFRPKKVPRNVDHLLLIGSNAHYINLLYGDILVQVDGGERLSAAMLRNAPSKFVLISEELPPSRRWPPWVYITPLSLFLIWAAWQWWPRRSENQGK